MLDATTQDEVSETMSLAQEKIPFGPEDYLVWEQEQPERNEFVDGETFAMSGASDAHSTVALNLAALLRSALRGTPCKPFIADMKVHVATANSFFYPDIVVTCDPRDRGPEASHVKQHPALIVEVLSPVRKPMIAATSLLPIASSNHCRNMCWSA
jgi:Uma2 family endonuclease